MQKKGKRNDDNIPFDDLINDNLWEITLLTGCAAVVIWVVANDSTVIGVIDDVLLPFLIPVVKKVFVT